MTGPFAGSGDRVVAADQADGVREIFVRAAMALHRRAPERAFFLAAARIGEDHRQGHLALAEVVALGLAHFGGVGIVIERVVDQLERDAEVAAVFVERLLLALGPLGNHRRDPAGGSEQRGGLRADDIEIAFLAGRDLALGGELVDLALGDHCRGVAEDLEHLQAAVLDHQLERAAEQEIAYQHGGRIAEHDVRRRLAAPEVRSVDHVVVQKRRGVDEFDRGGELVMARALVADELGPGERQHRPHPLAAARDQMPGERRDQRDFALHPLEDHRVDGVHRGGGKIEDRRQRGLGTGKLDNLGAHGSALARAGA